MRWLPLLSRLCLTTTFCVSFGLNTAFAQSSAADAEIKVWPEAFFQSVLSRKDELIYRYSNALFDGPTEVDLFRNDINENLTVGGSIKREIYNNYDLMNSWTVIDRFRMRLTPRLSGKQSSKLNFPLPSVNVGTPFGGLSLGPGRMGERF